MEPSDLLLMILGKKDRVIPGRTALQKTAYFVSVSLKMDLGFKAHFYGPYSPRVGETAEFLVQTDFLREEESSPAPGYTQYAYSLTGDGLKAATSTRKHHPVEDKRIQAIVETCENVAHWDTQVLSWAAKMHFLAKGGTKKVWTPEDITREGLSVGWNINPLQIRKGADLLLALGLVKPAQVK